LPHHKVTRNSAVAENATPRVVENLHTQTDRTIRTANLIILISMGKIIKRIKEQVRQKTRGCS